MATNFITSAIKQFQYYKLLGDRTFEQLNETQLFIKPNEESNSIATIVKHMHGNMLSRWTDFLTTDGEKEWRKRDAEFEHDTVEASSIQALWSEGWNCLFTALNNLTEEDLGKEIFIRNQGQSVMDAIMRQLAHYPYHVGQIVFVGKMLVGEKFLSLSIPKGNSNAFNAEKFAQPKHTAHFADEYLKKEKN